LSETTGKRIEEMSKGGKEEGQSPTGFLLFPHSFKRGGKYRWLNREKKKREAATMATNFKVLWRWARPS